tara:strand:+ start:388 stop:2562 length:2175 start_codon:yes stop_codon:yes gene_type:complete
VAISPADFYAYSRATGTPVPDSDEERARMAGDVINFRRNQLRAPAKQEDEGFNLTNALGIGAAALGLGAGALGLRSALAKKAAAAAGPVENPVVKYQNLEDLRRAAGYTTAPVRSEAPIQTPAPSKVAAQEPLGELWEATVPKEGFARSYLESKGSLLPAAKPDAGDRFIEEYEQLARNQMRADQRIQAGLRQAQPKLRERDIEMQRKGERVLAELRQEAADEAISSVSFQENLLNQARNQAANALESGEDQQTGRIKAQLQRNEDLDLGQVENLENIAQNSGPVTLEQDDAINRAASQLPDGLPVDQAEGLTSKPEYFIREKTFERPGAGLQQQAKRTLAYQTPTQVSVIGQYPPSPETSPYPTAKFPGELGSSAGDAIVVTAATPIAGLRNIRRDGVEFTAQEARVGETGRPARYTVLPQGTPTEGGEFTLPSPATLTEDQIAAKLEEIQVSKNAQIENTMARGLSQARARRNVQLTESQLQALEASLPSYSSEDIMSRPGVKGYGDLTEAERFSEEQSSRLGRLSTLEQGGFLEEEIDPGQLRVEPVQVRPGVMIRPASKTSYRGITGRPGFGIYGEQAPGVAGSPGFGAGAVEARKEIKVEGEERGITTPRAFVPGFDAPEARTPEGFVYTEEALARPTQAQGGYLSYGTRRYGKQTPTRPEFKRDSVDISSKLRQLQTSESPDEAQSFLDQIMKERGISALGKSQPLRQQINKRGRFGV